MVRRFYIILIEQILKHFREDNPIKIGTARIIIEKEELTGTYWTQAGTSGDIKLKNKEKRIKNKSLTMFISTCSH